MMTADNRCPPPCRCWPCGNASEHVGTLHLHKEAEADRGGPDVAPDRAADGREDGVGEVVGGDSKLLEEVHHVQLVRLLVEPGAVGAGGGGGCEEEVAPGGGRF